MGEVLLLLATLATPPDCSALAGWNSGRRGAIAVAECADETYQEGYRLGDALKELQDERDDIARDLPTLTVEAGSAARRRQRQIDIDLEAIRGLATIKAWPLDPPPEPSP